MEMNSSAEWNISSASYIGNPINNTVMYITKKVEYLLSNLETCDECLIFCEDTILIPDHLVKKHTFIQTTNPQYEYSKFVSKLACEIEVKRRNMKYKLTKEGYYIGENVKVGKNAIIEPLSFLDHDVIIGDNAKIYAGAKIKNAVIGNNFIASENSIIGSFGYLLARDEDNNHVRTPSLGKVYIGNNVEVGMHSNISVGSAGNTIIHNNVKIDALCYVGHDAILKNNVEICAGVVIGGYVVLEQDSFIGMNSTIRNRITIGEKAKVGMGSVVTKSIDSNITVVGNPAKRLGK